MHHVHFVSAKVWGGGEEYVYNLAKESLKHGDRVTLFLDERHAVLREHFAKFDCQWVPLNRSGLLKAYREVARFCRSEHVDTFNVHTGKLAFFAAILKKRLGVKTYFFKHNLVFGKTDVYHTWLTKTFDATICVSKACYETQIAPLPQALKSQFVCIPNGVPIPESSPRPTHDPMVFGFSGRIVENKGIEVLLKAFQLLDFPAELHIAGDDTTEYVQGLKARFPLPHVKWLGFQTEMQPFYEGIDVLVTPTLLVETFGLVICEALACCVPVIATNHGGPAEIIRDGVEGFLVEPHNVEDLKRAMTRCYTDGAWMAQAQLSARERVITQFSIERLYQALTQVYVRV